MTNNTSTNSMITVGVIVEKKYADETLVYVVDLPIFKFPGVKETPITNTKVEATVCVEPGNYEPYNINDKVYVGFVNNEFAQPVILGKIAKRFNEKENASVYQYINSLDVTESAILPKDTKIGDITYGDLDKIKNFVKINTKDEYTTKYIHNITMLYGNDSLRFTLSFVWENTNPAKYTSANIWSTLVNELIEKGYEVPSSITLPLADNYTSKSLFESLKMVRCNSAWDLDSSYSVTMYILLGIGARIDNDKPYIYIYSSNANPLSYTSNNRSFKVYRATDSLDVDVCWVNDTVIPKEG